MNAVETSGIQKTPGTSGGDARVRDTRIPVWLLVLNRKCGRSEAQILDSYPTLTQAGIDAAWDYYRDNPVEIEQTIWRADIAANVPDGTLPPTWVLVAGGLLGLSDDDVRHEFDPPVPAAALDAAWREYRADPAGIGRRIAQYRTAG